MFAKKESDGIQIDYTPSALTPNAPTPNTPTTHIPTINTLTINTLITNIPTPDSYAQVQSIPNMT